MITPTLTPRELDVARLLVSGLANKQIAHRIGISEHTVKNYLYSIYQKLHVSNRAQAAVTLVFTLRLVHISYVLTHQDIGQIPVHHPPNPSEPDP